MSLLYVDNLSSGYGKKKVLSNVSLAIEPAEIVTLIGSNGAGKSTLLKALYGLGEIWGEGKVLYKDKDITHAKPETLLSQGIVYIGQKSNTFDSFSVEENLKTAGYLYDKQTLKAKIDKLYTLLPKLKTLATQKVHSLSGGQRQLVALGMGMLHEPRLVLFDEPSAGLDVKHMREIFGIIESMKETEGVSFLIVEHRVREIGAITDRWVGLKLGEKVYDDSDIDEKDLNKVFL